MTRTLSYLEALGEGLEQEMRRDPRVVVFGEDNIGGTGCAGQRGTAWGVTKGLYAKFPDRVLDTPITESAFVGAAVGAAATGLRPVAELLFVDLVGVCFDQFLNQAAKLRYMTGGQVTLPLVVRMMCGAGMRGAAQHSQNLHAIFAHVPGLRLAAPSNPFDAKGLMTQAIRDDNPVVLFEHKMLYFDRGDVPEEPYAIPFGRAAVLRAGVDCTIVAIGRMVSFALQAAEALATDGIDCEVVDPRTLIPLDEDTIRASIARTGRLVVVDEASPRCSVASEVAAIAARDCLYHLRAPVATVTAPAVPPPYSPVLEDHYIPGPEQIVAAVRRAVGAAVPVLTS